MLVIGRKTYQSIVLRNRADMSHIATIQIVSDLVKGHSVRLGITAGLDVLVMRDEIDTAADQGEAEAAEQTEPS